jgi:hypothetical protein
VLTEGGHTANAHAVFEHAVLASESVGAAEESFAARALAQGSRLTAPVATEASLVAHLHFTFVDEVARDIFALRNTGLAVTDFLPVIEDYAVALTEGAAAVLAHASGLAAAGKECFPPYAAGCHHPGCHRRFYGIDSNLHVKGKSRRWAQYVC